MLRFIILCFLLSCSLRSHAFAQVVWEEVPLTLSDYIIGKPLARNDTVFVYTQQSGLFRSPDFGQTWQKTTLDTSLQSFHPMIATMSGIFFPSTYTAANLLRPLESTFFRSTDGGNTWRNVLRFPGLIWSVFTVGEQVLVNNNQYPNLSISPDPISVTWRSRDNGATWSQKRSDTLFTPLFFDANILYGQHNNVLYVSLDTAQTWNAIRRDADSTVRVASLIRSNNFLIASLYAEIGGLVQNKGLGLIRRADNSTQWETLSTGFNMSGSVSLAVHRNSVYALSNDALLRSVNNGSNWDRVRIPQNAAMESIVSIANRCLILKYVNNTLWRSFDEGGTWEQINKGLANQQMEKIVVANDSVYIAAEKMWLLSLRDTGTVYKPVALSNFSISRQYLSTQLLTSNGGQGIQVFSCFNPTNPNSATAVFQEIDPTLTGMTLNEFCLPRNATLTFARYGIRLFMMASGRVLRRLDNINGSWQNNFLALLNPDSTKERYSSFAINQNTVLLGTERGLYRTQDGGATWQASGMAGQRVFALATMGTVIFAGTNNGIFRSSDTGRTWQTSGLQGDTVLNFSMRDTRTIFVGTQFNGVFASGDQGRTWQNLSANLPSKTIRSSGISRQGIAFALTPLGLFRTKQPVTTSVKERTIGASTMIQIQPHPVSSSAEIIYTLQEAGIVEVDIYDMLGRVVASFPQGYQPSGEQRYFVQIAGLADGCYFVRLKTSRGTVSRQMMIVR